MYVILNQQGAFLAAVEVPMNDTNVSHCRADLSGVVGIGDVVNQQETDIDINATTANQCSATSTEMTATEAASLVLDQEESAMPDSWIFPGFIIFALLGPIIVPPELLQYRVELLMTSTPDILCNTDLAHAGDRKKRRRAKGRLTARNAVALEERGGSKATTTSSNSSRHSTAGISPEALGRGGQELSLSQTTNFITWNCPI
jgi:hypothetical protein